MEIGGETVAEFAEVMRQWGRYCKGYTENHDDDCDGCPLEINGSCNSYAKDNAQYAEQIEKSIMSWAAEYSEPVYPTWREYLMSLIMPYGTGDWSTLLLEHRITPDIASKLGIQPKEAKK